MPKVNVYNMQGKIVEEIELDSVIAAIGQRNDPAGFEALPHTSKGTLTADEATFATSIPGVFACGDTVNKGAGIAIGAIAQANEAACAIDAFLAGGTYAPRKPIVSERKLTEADFADRPRMARAAMPHRSADVRRNDFAEVNLGLSAEQAQAEAKRCLECGCHDYADCKLIRYANLVQANCTRLGGEYHPGFEETRLVTIERNQRKCILCNLCVRICADEAKQGLLGLVDRGFKTVIKPSFRNPAAVDACRTCGLCEKNCPTGALKIIGG